MSDYISFLFESPIVCIAKKFSIHLEWFYSHAVGVSLLNSTWMLEHMFQNSCFQSWEGLEVTLLQMDSLLACLSLFPTLTLSLTHRCMCRCTLVYVSSFSLHRSPSASFSLFLFSFISECINPDERCVGENFPLCSDPLICCTWLP